MNPYYKFRTIAASNNLAEGVYFLDPILVFLIAGAFAMSAAIFASKLLKLPVDEQPEWAQGKSGNVRILLGGNLFAIALIAAVVYGFYHLVWWIPVACLFITFPVIHVIILEKILSPGKGFLFSGICTVACLPLLWLYW